jgi:hypothetical protein
VVSLFHLGCGFVLLLAVINEDIMPGYTLVLISMLLAGLWFDQPTWRRVAVVGVVFTVGWLIEWRLIFPTLPAFVLVLAIADQPWRERAKMIGVLLLSIVATAGIVQQAWEGHNGAVGLHDLLWTGKGVDSGWGGFGWGKAWMMLAGVRRLLPDHRRPHSPGRRPGGLAVAGGVARPAARDPAVQPSRAVAAPVRSALRAIAVVFLGTLGAGQILNFYSQPHDPQMQVNVMVWLSIAFALLAMAASRRFFIVLAVLASVPLVHNVATFARWRGGDAEAIAALKTIEQRFEPAKTVFVYWGFEQIAMWHYALWSRTWDWDGKPNDARFKWIAITAGAIRHRRLDAAAACRGDPPRPRLGLRQGYRVVISDVWTWSAATLAGKLASLGAANRAAAIYACCTTISTPCRRSRCRTSAPTTSCGHANPDALGLSAQIERSPFPAVLGRPPTVSPTVPAPARADDSQRPNSRGLAGPSHRCARRPPTRSSPGWRGCRGCFRSSTRRSASIRLVSASRKEPFARLCCRP